MTSFLKFSNAILAVSLVCAAGSSYAIQVAPQISPTGPITYNLDFNSMGLNDTQSVGAATSYGLGSVASSTTISTFVTNALQAKLPAADTPAVAVTVTGALATKTYTAENRLPTNTTLGANNQTFLVNNNFTTQGKSDFIDFTFRNFVVTSIDFMYEIFPSNECSTVTLCSVPADFTFSFGTGGALIDSFTTKVDATTKTLGVDGKTNYLHVLKDSGLINTGYATELRFSDWPAEIGVGNIVLTGCVPGANGKCVATVPEPTTVALLGLGLFGLATSRRKSAKNKNA